MNQKRLHRVLIVDDDKTISGLTKEMIESKDIYRVRTAANGGEGYMRFSSTSNPMSSLPIS